MREHLCLVFRITVQCREEHQHTDGSVSDGNMMQWILLSHTIYHLLEITLHCDLVYNGPRMTVLNDMLHYRHGKCQKIFTMLFFLMGKRQLTNAKLGQNRPQKIRNFNPGLTFLW